MEAKMFTDDRMPITKEFLEKNGFHKQNNCYTIANLAKTNVFWIIEITFATERSTYIKRIEIENVDGNNAINVNMSTIGGKIYFVHELQHAITMCNINLNLK